MILLAFFVWMDFGPAFSSRGRYKTVIALRAAAYVAHTIRLWVALPPLGDAYVPPTLGGPTYHTALLVCLFVVHMGIGPALVDLIKGPDGYCRTHALLRLPRARTIY